MTHQRMHRQWHQLSSLKDLWTAHPDSIKTSLLENYGIINEHGEFLGIRYYLVTDTVMNCLLGLVPESIRDKMRVRYMEITTDYLPPHRDNGTLLSWNFYVATQDATTSFWKEAPTGQAISFGSTGKLYDESQLSLLDNFTAQPGESWLLDVSTIHSVQGKGNGVRTAFVLTTDSFTWQEFRTILASDPNY